MDTSRHAMFGTLLASQPKRNLKSAVTTTLGSIFVHAVIIAVLVVVTMKAAKAAPERETFTLTHIVDPPKLIEPPPPMIDVKPPTVESSEAPRGFPTLPTPDVVPNVIPLDIGAAIRAEDYTPIGVAGGSPTGNPALKDTTDLGKAPYMVPMEVMPRLLNQPEVEKAVVRNYPPMMRDAGIGGRTNVWIRLNEEGKVVTWQVKASSGMAVFDSAASKVVPSLKFSPALNQDKKIAVWIQMDIVFKVR